MPLAIGHKLEVWDCIARQQLSQHNLACGQCIQTGGNFTFLGLYTPTPLLRFFNSADQFTGSTALLAPIKARHDTII